MATKTNSGDPVLPCTDGSMKSHLGITKREFFAVMLAKSYIDKGYRGEEAAINSVNAADMLIKALNRE